MAQQPNQFPANTTPDLGALLHSRRYSPTNYLIAAAAMFVPLPAVALFAILTGPPQSTGYKLGVFAFCVGLGAIGASRFLYLGLRKRGLIVQAYEQGMRLAWPSGRQVAFRFADVQEIQKMTFKGALARLTFLLADGQSFTVDVHGSKDVQMLNDVLVRFGPMYWEADRGFRIM